MHFEWDPPKAERNERKHGVAFPSATSAFGDSRALSFDDPEHAEDEPRWILIGYDLSGRLLTIAYTLRDAAIRVISARRSTPSERKLYEEANY
jgi:uncharacterized protein